MKMRMLPWHFSRIVVLKTETPLLPSWAIFVRNLLLFLTFVRVVAEPVGVTAVAVTD